MAGPRTRPTARRWGHPNTKALHGLYSSAPQKMKRIAPRDIGQKRIGHLGFFRAQQEQALWRPHLLPELSAR